jgi:hypothetical protein
MGKHASHDSRLVIRPGADGTPRLLVLERVRALQEAGCGGAHLDEIPGVARLRLTQLLGGAPGKHFRFW